MSEGSHSMGDEHAVVGEPASHPHQAVVVGEPPEAADPVLGEPAFSNGLQDQQPILPSSTEDTCANGVQSVSHSPPSTHVSTPVEESPNSHQVVSAEDSESGIREADTHQVEPHVTENSGISGAPVDEAPDASDVPVARTSSAEIPAHRAEGESGEDFADSEITHIVESPSQVSGSWSEPPSENPYAALEEEEEEAAATGENSADDLALTDGAHLSITPDAISKEVLGDQQEESTAQGKPGTEESRSIPVDTEGVSLEGSKAADENVSTTETEQGGQGENVDQKSDFKEAKPELEDNSSVSPSLELDQGSEKLIKDSASEPETMADDVGKSLSKEADQLEAPALEVPTSNKDVVNENHVAQLKEEVTDELPPVDSTVGTRDIAVEDRSVNPPPSAANGNNSYQHGEGGLIEKEQDFPKVDDDDANAEVEKSGFRSKLPFIFTGLAIAAVGVVVASISRPR